MPDNSTGPLGHLRLSQIYPVTDLTNLKLVRRTFSSHTIETDVPTSANHDEYYNHGWSAIYKIEGWYTYAKVIETNIEKSIARYSLARDKQDKNNLKKYIS
jgi:hypothetical protein